MSLPPDSEYTYLQYQNVMNGVNEQHSTGIWAHTQGIILGRQAPSSMQAWERDALCSFSLQLFRINQWKHSAENNDPLGLL